MSNLKSKSALPFELVEEALAFIETTSLKRQEIDWHIVRQEFLSEARVMKSNEEAHQAIKRILKMLDDNHSFLWTPQGLSRHKTSDKPGFRLHQKEPVVIDVFPESPAEKQGLQVGDRILKVGNSVVSSDNWSNYYLRAFDVGTELTVFDVNKQKERELCLESGFTTSNPLPISYKTAQGFGLLDLPGHMGDGDLDDSSSYAEVIQTALLNFEAQGVKAWIIDLRRNDGGNMWPMLAELTPLLGTGTYGSFVDPVDGNDWLWRFDGNEVGSYNKKSRKKDYAVPVSDFRPLGNLDAPVAILTSEVTSSSGELVLISFLGRPKTKTFGLSTGGLSRSKGMKQLADGSSLFVTGHWGADRLERIYKGAIKPNVPVEIDWALFAQTNDPVIMAAESWLRTTLSG